MSFRNQKTQFEQCIELREKEGISPSIKGLLYRFSYTATFGHGMCNTKTQLLFSELTVIINSYIGYGECVTEAHSSNVILFSVLFYNQGIFKSLLANLPADSVKTEMTRKPLRITDHKGKQTSG